MKSLSTVLAFAFFLWTTAVDAHAQTGRFEIGAQVSSVVSGQFEGTDVGVGGRVAWHPAPALGVEGEFNFYPSEFPDEESQRPFSDSRVEGLFGLTLGPRLGLVRPFGRLRYGFLNVAEASEPFPCIRIFPPPLSCTLAAGATLPAFDLGAGLEVFATSRVLLRLDVGDRLLKYPGPSIDEDGTRREDSFFGHDFRLAAGAALRF